MPTGAPFWIGIAGTLLALAMFVNGWRLVRLGRHARGMGRVHMFTAPLLIFFMWFIILRLMP